MPINTPSTVKPILTCCFCLFHILRMFMKWMPRVWKNFSHIAFPTRWFFFLELDRSIPKLLQWIANNSMLSQFSLWYAENTSLVFESSTSFGRIGSFDQFIPRYSYYRLASLIRAGQVSYRETSYKNTVYVIISTLVIELMQTFLIYFSNTTN